jgi:hypothetical protein
MPRKPKQPGVLAEGETAAAVAQPPAETNGTPVPPPADGPAPNRPTKAIWVAAGDGVRIEGAVWPREIVVAGEPVTAYSATVRKTHRGEDGEYRHTGSFRGSEVPLVQYVLGRCAEWILDQRREEDPPF